MSACALLRGQLVAQRGAAGQRVGHFAEGHLDAFSYCATAMSRPAFAASRLFWLRPASNSGWISCGVKLHAVWSNNVDSWSLA